MRKRSGISASGVRLTKRTTPASRPFRLTKVAALNQFMLAALQQGDGVLGAHCVHELWMRGEMAVNVEALLERLWKSCGATVPDWLPMRHIEWLSLAYDVAGQFAVAEKGRSNIYLILLDYTERSQPYGVYVGMSRYSPLQRFDQHKAGIRSAGSVLKRGIEPLVGPTMHLQHINRAAAERIEGELADALRAAGLFVQGGH
jgi:hypothetical protein